MYLSRNIQQSKLSLNLEVDFGKLLRHMLILCMGSHFVFFFLLLSRELIFLLTGQKSFAIYELMGGGSLKRKCWQRLTQNFQPYCDISCKGSTFILFYFYITVQGKGQNGRVHQLFKLTNHLPYRASERRNL